MWNVMAKVIPVTTGGDWNNFRITQAISEQQTKRARNYGTANNSHIGHCTRTAKSADIKIKCKGIPLQALTGPRGSRRLRLPEFKTIGT
jgi:hypothetical protein